jgi:1,4-dihydroxy-2-naphthoyl-CoA hydrolase
MIWKHAINLDVLNESSINSLSQHLGIEFTDFGTDFLTAKMPVDHRTVQPYGILHGGASVALAETLGSVAGLLSLEDPNKEMTVGVEINANHLKPANKGFVYGTVKPVRIGKNIQVWNIEIKNEDGQLTCVSRITLAVVPNRTGIQRI